MARRVYKIGSCKDPVKCRHPWWFSFKPAGVPRIRKSLDAVLNRRIESKTAAEAEAERLRLAILDDELPPAIRERLGLEPSAKPTLPVLTIGQLLDTYLTRALAANASKDRSEYQIGVVKRTELPGPDGRVSPLGDWYVGDLTTDALERLREVRSVQTTVHRGKRVTVIGGAVAANRDLRLLRAAYNWGLRTGYVERTPFKRGGEPTMRLKGEPGRSRRLQDGERERLLAACGSHLRLIVEAALETGCRRGELMNMQWSQVQLDGSRPELWLPAGKTKTAKARRVPISSRLRMLLEMRRDAMKATADLDAETPLPGNLHVFGNEIGGKSGAFKTAWRLTCKRAGIEDLHFHDLRREAGSRWMEEGVPLATIQRWLRHTNIARPRSTSPPR